MIALIAAAAFAFTPVTVPGATIFNFYGPNDKGQIPLSTTIGGGIWQNGNFTLLPPPPSGVADVEPTGINNDGVHRRSCKSRRPDRARIVFSIHGRYLALMERSSHFSPRLVSCLRW